MDIVGKNITFTVLHTSYVSQNKIYFYKKNTLAASFRVRYKFLNYSLLFLYIYIYIYTWTSQATFYNK